MHANALTILSTREHVRQPLFGFAERAAAEERTSGVDEPLQIGLVDHVRRLHAIGK